ncbi:alpha/beta hydrolase [Sphingomonas sp. HDW15A]|uniref:alpha/beta hydrolase n=1 Tax=Sphingomonas sp. HDW15A TaxID=2714942 RepID=UPI001F0EE912|nr:alpha/beta hydrolase [Sphingomonas sp. HDW15A]
MSESTGLRWTSFDGLRLFARDYRGTDDDQRLPVICLHGLTRNSRDFENLAPILAAEGRRVIAPDIRAAAFPTEARIRAVITRAFTPGISPRF